MPAWKDYNTLHLRIFSRSNVIYCLAALILTLLTLFIRAELSVVFGNRPLLILLVFPIIISAYLGGFIPGFFATAISMLIFFEIFRHGFRLEQTHDVLQWGMLLVIGIIVSILSEFLHNAKRREKLHADRLGLMLNDLSESESRFESTFEQAAVGIAHVGIDGKWLRVNKKICEIVGYTRDEFLSLTFQDITHPDDLDADLEFVRLMLTGGIATYTMEKRYIRKNGDIVWIDLTVSSNFSSNGELEYFISVIQDINNRKKVEASLIESEARYHGILDSMIEGCQIIDFNFRYRYVNNAVISHSHKTRFELEGRLMTDVYPGIDETEMFRHLKKCMSDRIPHRMINEFQYGDGTRGWFDLSIQPAPEGVFILSIDITEKMLFEVSLYESSQRMKLFIDHAPSALAMLDRDMRYLAVSRRWLNDYGLQEKDLIGKSHYEMFPEISEEWREIHRRGLAGETIKNDDDRFDRGDGSVQYLRWEVIPWHSVDGSVGGIVIFSEDITARKSAEEELRKYREHLEEMIAERTEELETASRAKSDFLASMSHELRTPLNSIIGFSEIMLDGITGSMTDEQREYLGDIHESGNHLLSLINDILDLSKVESGKMELELSRVSVKSVLKSTYSLFREKSLKHNIKIDTEIKLDEDAEFIVADERKVKQVLYNIVSNAVKFTPDGGKIVISAELSGINVEPFIKFMVSDTGIGISDEYHEKVFEPFYQVDNSITRSFSGTGLGLSISRSFVELHGGELWYESRPDAGSRFFFTIPVRNPGRL